MLPAHHAQKRRRRNLRFRHVSDHDNRQSGGEIQENRECVTHRAVAAREGSNALYCRASVYPPVLVGRERLAGLGGIR